VSPRVNNNQKVFSANGALLHSQLGMVRNHQWSLKTNTKHGQTLTTLKDTVKQNPQSSHFAGFVM
jgi:hypothetical protein